MAAPRQATDADALLKAILQESANEVVIFDADSLRILQANHAATHNLRFPLPDLQQRTLPDCLAPEAAQPLADLLALLRSGRKRRASLKAHCLRRDGTRYAVEARLFRSVGQGQPVFVWIASRQMLEPSASELRDIVAHIPGMAYQVRRSPDGDPTLSYVSEQSEQLLGIRAAALRAAPERFFDLILDADRPDYLARLAEAGGGHMTFDWEGRIWVEAWQDVKWVNIRVTRVDAPDGQTWDGIMLNVTRSKQAEAEIRHSRAQMSALAAHVESVEEFERLKLAREVHDDLGGNLTAIKIGLSWLARNLPSDPPRLLERVRYLDDVVDQTFEAAHRIASNLRPPALDFGIVSALDWHLQHFGRNAEIASELSAPAEAIPLDGDTAIAVFRIVQEALTNVAKHARATRVRVGLAVEDGTLALSVTDDGVGIPPSRGAGDVPGFGLLGMRERAAALGGELTIRPARSRGTEVRLRVPLAPRRRAGDEMTA